MKLINAHRTGEQCIICIENNDGKRINAEISRTDYNQLIIGLNNVPSIRIWCFVSQLQPHVISAEEFLKEKGIDVNEEIMIMNSGGVCMKVVDICLEFLQRQGQKTNQTNL